MTLSEALQREKAGEGSVRFENGVPTWAPLRAPRVTANTPILGTHKVLSDVRAELERQRDEAQEKANEAAKVLEALG